MTATLDDVAKKMPVEVSAEQQAAAELVRMAKERGLSLTGPDGLLKQMTKSVIETALDEEMTDHPGYAKGDRAGIGAENIRNGTRAKAVLPASTGPVEIDVPRDRAGCGWPRSPWWWWSPPLLLRSGSSGCPDTGPDSIGGRSTESLSRP